MAKTKGNATGGDMPMTEQQRFPSCCDDLGMTNAKPLCDEYELDRSWPGKQTFCVRRRGNSVTKGGNY